MPYHTSYLKYAISDWHQLPNARSNTDPTLKIRVTDFVNSDILQGTRIQVTHPQYGVLLSFMVNLSGRIVSSISDIEITTDIILAALSEFGFDVQFNNSPKLNEATQVFLQGALNSGYTHIRWAIKKHLPIPSGQSSKGNCTHDPCTGRKERIVICFNESKRPDFLKQYIEPIENFGGDVMEVSPDRNPRLDFSWLDFPMHIKSVLTDNL